MALRMFREKAGFRQTEEQETHPRMRAQHRRAPGQRLVQQTLSRVEIKLNKRS